MQPKYEIFYYNAFHSISEEGIWDSVCRQAFKNNEMKTTNKLKVSSVIGQLAKAYYSKGVITFPVFIIFEKNPSVFFISVL